LYVFVSSRVTTKLPDVSRSGMRHHSLLTASLPSRGYPVVRWTDRRRYAISRTGDYVPPRTG